VGPAKGTSVGAFENGTLVPLSAVSFLHSIRRPSSERIMRTALSADHTGRGKDGPADCVLGLGPSALVPSNNL
jgi:hypothetical protein